MQTNPIFTTTAYTELEKMAAPTVITEKLFCELIIYFRVSLLDEIDFTNRLQKHRKPVEYLYQVLGALHDSIRVIQLRPEMADINGNCHCYVTTSINILWEEDKTLRSLFAAVQEYCKLRNKDFNTIAVHIAEYRAVNKLARSIQRRISSITRSKPCP
jgi:hypothetical protein